MPGLFYCFQVPVAVATKNLFALNRYSSKFNGDYTIMNHDAMEALMEAIMNENESDTTPHEIDPAPRISKRRIALLMIAAALFGALIAGVAYMVSSPQLTHPEIAEPTVNTTNKPKMNLFFFGVGHYHE